MGVSPVGDKYERLLSGVSISIVGVLSLAIPLYDMWEDFTNLDWSFLVTSVENAALVFLAGTLIGGGIWLVRCEWKTKHVRSVAVRTIVGTLGVAILFGWIVLVQLWAMHDLKPLIIALDGILIGAVTTFSIGLYSARADIRQNELERTRKAGERLEQLHQFATDLQDAKSRESAHETVLDAVGTMLSPGVARIIVDDEVVAQRTLDTLSFEGNEAADISVSIDGYGRIELVRGPFAEHERKLLELTGTHLSRAFNRLDREQDLRREHERLEFINRTVRHNLLNDINTIQARLELIDSDNSFTEHRDVVLSRIDDMADFIRTMRSYTNTLVADDRDLRPVPLEPTLEDVVSAHRESYPDAEIHLGNIPDVDVLADSLLNPLFENLLTNAVEHNDKRTPEIQIDATLEDDAVQVQIADNGPGISDDRKERIFDQGEHGEESSGTGFGLYLVKDAIETYGGSIDVRDNDPQGTVFNLRIPLAEEETG